MNKMSSKRKSKMTSKRKSQMRSKRKSQMRSRKKSQMRSRRKSQMRSRKKSQMRSRRKSISRRKSKKRSRSKVRIPVTKGKLFGYHIDSLARDRKSLLKGLIRSKKATFSEVIKRLNALVIYNKKKHPETSKKIKRDMNYIEKHMSQYRLSPKK